MPDSNLYIQVRDYLTGVYEGSSSPAPPSAAREQTVLAFLPMGWAISPIDFTSNRSDPLTDPNAHYSPSIGVQRTYQYSDFVPAIDQSGALQETLRTVVGQYSMILEESQATDISNSTGFATFKAPAMEALRNALMSALDTSGVGESMQFYPVNATPSDWYDSSHQSNWNSINFRAQPMQSSVTPSTALTVSSGVNSGLGDCGLAWSVPTSNQGPVGSAQMMRQRGSGDDPNYERVVVERPVLQQRRAPAPNTPISTPPLPPTQPTPPASQPLSGPTLSFDYCLVNIDRPWLSVDFLSSTGWYLSGRAAGALSDGNDVSGNYPFSAIPVAFIAVKNVKVSANWTEADKQAATTATSLGQFALVNAFFADGETLSVPGMQILAWVCRKMPQLPPASDPALSVISGAPVSPTTPSTTPATSAVSTPVIH